MSVDVELTCLAPYSHLGLLWGDRLSIVSITLHRLDYTLEVWASWYDPYERSLLAFLNLGTPVGVLYAQSFYDLPKCNAASMRSGSSAVRAGLLGVLYCTLRHVQIS